MEYTTQMDAARKGIFTPEMAKVAEKEHLEPKKLMALMAEGKVIIPCNKGAYMHRAERSRLHAEDEDQRQSRHVPRPHRP